MKKTILTFVAAMVLPVLAMAQCPPSSVTATVTLQFAGPGMLDGEFSVSGVKKVNFSQGNLQYQARTNTWRFADNQWDFVGDGGTTAGNVTGSDNAQISSSYAGWIDLFGWATSGSSKSNIYGYMPYYTTTDNTHYGPNIIINNIQWTSENSDWGTVNAVQLGLGWYTLSKAEWDYLLNTRTNAANLKAIATVHGVPGLLLLPDGWKQINSRISATLTMSTYGSYATNTISNSDWTILEYEGAVFLPAAGRRSDTSVESANVYGYYWTSTAYYFKSSTYPYPITEGVSYALVFRETITPSATYTESSIVFNRYFGQSVRLVK